jgi:gliding motility-associated-like protein
MKLSKMNINKWFLTLAILVYSIAGFAQTTVNLSNHQPAAVDAPSGSVFEWHNVLLNQSPASKLSGSAITAATSSTNYGVFRDISTSCYSPAVRVDVIIGSCGAPSVDISSYATSTAQWFADRAHSGTAITASAATAGVFFPFEVAGSVYTPIDQVVIVSLNALPTAYAVSGTGSYCTGGTGIAVGLANSTSGVNYQLQIGGANTGALVAGTGSAISFGLKTAAGTYTVIATNATTTCTVAMTGNAIITVNPLPTDYAVTGAGSYCTGGTGLAVGLANSTLGVNYQLQIGGANTGALVAGTGSAISFGLQTAAGTYTVIATNATTTCTLAMTGSAVIAINPLPTAYAVSGTGSYCSGGTGVAVGLVNSTSGVNYQLQIGGTNTGALVSGTGSAISFGLQTAAGSYTVIATNATTTCTAPMTGNAVITVNPLPSATIAYASPNCATGLLSVTQSGQTGGTYTSTTGLVISSTTGEINLGTSTAGTYTVTYTFSNGTCSNTAIASVIINALPTATISYISPNCGTGTGTVTLVGQTGGTYSSSSPALILNSVNGDINLGTSTPGTYTVTYAFTNGTCSNTTTVSVTINVLPIATISYVTPNCATGLGAVTQTGKAGGAYTSTTGLNINSTTGEINLGTSTAGNYTVTYTFTDGTCTNTATASLTINAIPTATPALTGSTAANVCPTTTTVNLTALVSGTTTGIEWFTNNSNPPTGTAYATPATVSVSGTYYAFYKNGSGCYGPASTGVVVTVNVCPAPPTINTPITVNADGTISIYGTAVPNSTVTVTFPDGTTGTVVANGLGIYGAVKSATPQTTGIISATATVAGNVSAPATAPYTDNTKPLAPTIDTVITNPNGTVSVIGTAEPNSTVTVTFPDGTTGTYSVLADGKYGPITSVSPQNTGKIIATAKDLANNVSPEALFNYDVTAPAMPTITTPITLNSDGTISVYGTAEIGSLVTVTFPDGTTGTYTADGSGNYGPIKSATVQASGDIKATAKDAAGNVSAPATFYYDVTPPAKPTIDTVITNPNGTIAVSGTAEIGSTVIVTFPDGTKSLPLLVGLSGTYGPVTSAGPQTTGTIYAQATDAAGNKSPIASYSFNTGTDITKPLPPTIDLVTANPNGTISVSGTAEPKSTVTVTFPDGTTGTYVVLADGKYGPVTSATPQTDGVISAIATDVAGNISDPTTVNYIDSTKPLPPTIMMPITVNSDGTISVYGTAEPKSTVTVTFPDGTTGTYVVLADGKYGPVTSATTQKDGVVSAIATDVAGNISDPTTVNYAEGCVIEVFNGLTPGGDGKNDVFYIKGIECFPNNSIQVFNRWGIVVFDKTGYNNADRAFRGLSDGNLTVAKAEELPVGTYYYVFKYTDNAAVSHEKAGYLYINK